MNPFQDAPMSKKVMTLIGIYIAQTVSIVVSSGSGTLLPIAAGEVGGMDIYPLANTVIGLCGVCAMPLFGYLGAKNPSLRRKLFSFSLLVGTIAIFCRAIAPNMWVIIVPSFFFGLVSAANFGLGYSMIRDMFDVKRTGAYLGLVGTFQSIGVLAGPVITGAIIDIADWRMMYYIIPPLFLLSAVLVFFGVKVSTADAKPLASASGKFDLLGAISLTLFLGGIILALSLASSFAKFGSLASNLMFAVSALGLILLIVDISKKKGEAIVPVPVLKDKNTCCLVIGNLFSNFSNIPIYFFLPAYAIMVIGVSATEASLLTTLMSVAGLFMGPILGRMIAKAGTARPVLFGSSALRIIVAAVLLFILSPSVSIWLVYVVMLIAGFYGSGTSVTFSTGPQVQIDPEIRQMSNAIIQVSQNLGGSIGSAVFTLVIGMAGGVQAGFMTCIILSLVTAVIALVASLPLKKLEVSSESVNN
jgi:MFS family permease